MDRSRPSQRGAPTAAQQARRPDAEIAYGGEASYCPPTGTLWNDAILWRSFRFDAGELDHFGPFLGLLGNELPEIGRRAGEHRTSKVGEPLVDAGIGETRVDLSVELVGDIRRRASRSDNPVPPGCLIARQKFR